MHVGMQPVRIKPPTRRILQTYNRVLHKSYRKNDQDKEYDFMRRAKTISGVQQLESIAPWAVSMLMARMEQSALHSRGRL